MKKESQYSKQILHLNDTVKAVTIEHYSKYIWKIRNF